MQILSSACKVLIVLTAALGLIIKSNILKKKYNKGMFIYFTHLSALFSLVYFSALLFLGDTRHNGILPRMNGAVIICVSMTMLVYHFMLVPELKGKLGGYRFFSFSELAVHYIVPLLTIVHWLAFSPKGLFSFWDPLLWLTPLLLYFGMTIIVARRKSCLGQTGSRYPYFFIDIDHLGLKKVMRNVCIIGIAVLLFGYILVLIDKGLGLVLPNG